MKKVDNKIQSNQSSRVKTLFVICTMRRNLYLWDVEEYIISQWENDFIFWNFFFRFGTKDSQNDIRSDLNPTRTHDQTFYNVSFTKSATVYSPLCSLECSFSFFSKQRKYRVLEKRKFYAFFFFRCLNSYSRISNFYF